MTHVRPYEALGALCVSILFDLNVEASFRKVYGEEITWNPLTNEDKQDIFKLHTEHKEEMTDIAEMYSVSISYISKVIKELGGGDRRLPNVPIEIKQRIFKLHEEGLQNYEIADMCGVNRPYVSKLLGGKLK